LEKLKIVIWACAKCGEIEDVAEADGSFLCHKCGSTEHVSYDHEGPFKIVSDKVKPTTPLITRLPMDEVRRLAKQQKVK
jgi:ribosomal protein S27AE